MVCTHMAPNHHWMWTEYTDRNVYLRQTWPGLHIIPGHVLMCKHGHRNQFWLSLEATETTVVHATGYLYISSLIVPLKQAFLFLQKSSVLPATKSVTTDALVSNVCIAFCSGGRQTVHQQNSMNKEPHEFKSDLFKSFLFMSYGNELNMYPI